MSFRKLYNRIIDYNNEIVTHIPTVASSMFISAESNRRNSAEILKILEEYGWELKSKNIYEEQIYVYKFTRKKKEVIFIGF